MDDVPEQSILQVVPISAQADPGGAKVDLVDLASAVGVQRGIALKALARLHRFEVMHFSSVRAVVGVSGFAPSVQGGRLLRLSKRGRLVHDRLLATSEIARPSPLGRAVQAGAGRLSERLPAPVPGGAL